MLAPELQQLLKTYQDAKFPPFSSLTPIEVRRRLGETFKQKPKPPEINLYKITSTKIDTPTHNLQLRIFYPYAGENLPTLMYFHGGGFVIRDNMDIYDYTCRLIAKEVGCVVIAVNYRLAPEHPFPAATEDCYFATRWIANHSQELGINKSHFGVLGESCGGNLSTVVAMMARDKNTPRLKCQIIISPMLDIDFNRHSYLDYAEGYLLTRDTMQWFWGHYLSKDADKKNPYALPLLAKDLTNLPQALVVTTEFDVLKDEGELYSQRLMQAGVKTIYRCYPSLIHGFFDHYNIAPLAKLACQDIFQHIKNLLLN